MGVTAEFTVTPLGVGTSLSKYVAMAVEVVQNSGLNYRLTPMGTVIEGEWDDIFKVIKQSQERLAGETDRVIINLRADWQRGNAHGIETNVEHVQEKLSKPART